MTKCYKNRSPRKKGAAALFSAEVDKMPEQRQHVGTVCLFFAGHPFRVELGGQDRQAFVFDGFEDAVFCCCGGNETVSKGINGLVVIGIGQKGGAEKGLHPASGQAAYRVEGGDGFVVVPVGNGFRLLAGNILNEGAAQGHVDQLLAPADAQDGLACLDKGFKQLQLHLSTTLMYAALVELT